MTPKSQERLLLTGTLLLFFVVAELVAKAFLSSPLPWMLPQVAYDKSASLGFRLRPLQTSYTADKPVRTNAMGLRGPDVTWVKPAGTRRVVVLGDSIAFGYGIREEDTFSRRLERYLNDGGTARYQVINTGVPAFNTVAEVTYFREEGIRFDPDVVILAAFWNDIAEKAGEGVTVDRLGRLVDADAPEQPARVNEWLASDAGYQLRNFLKRSTFLHFTVDRFRQLKSTLSSQRSWTEDARTAVLTNRPHDRIARGFQTIDAQLGELNAFCQERGIELVIALLPMPQLLGRHNFTASQYPATIKRACARRALRCVDMLPAFERQFDGHTSLFIPYDEHPNERGHEVIAATLYATLTTESVFEGALSAR